MIAIHILIKVIKTTYDLDYTVYESCIESTATARVYIYDYDYDKYTRKKIIFMNSDIKFIFEL